MLFLRLAKLSWPGFILLCAGIAAPAAPPFPPEQAGKLLPAAVGDLNATSPSVALDQVYADKIGDFNAISAASRRYRSKNGNILVAALVLTRSDASAFSLVTNMCASDAEQQTLAGLEMKSCVSPAKVRFTKGPVYVAVGKRRR
jgi:hypothetical protein